MYTHVNEKTFKIILNSIEAKARAAAKNGQPMEPVLILVDDCAGTRAIHGKRFGAFAHLAVQTKHWNISMVVITQQPSSLDPNFRQNAENVIVFPSQGKPNVEWLEREYQTVLMGESAMKQIAIHAFRGGKKDNSEWGKHFLYIQARPRHLTKFFSDFNREIIIYDESDGSTNEGGNIRVGDKRVRSDEGREKVLQPRKKRKMEQVSYSNSTNQRQFQSGIQRPWASQKRRRFSNLANDFRHGD